MHYTIYLHWKNQNHRIRLQVGSVLNKKLILQELLFERWPIGKRFGDLGQEVCQVPENKKN